MFMDVFGWGLAPSIAGMVVIQAGIALALYKGLISRYIRQEEIVLTGLLLVAIIAEQAGHLWYPIQAAVYLPTTIISGSSDIGGTSISNQLICAGIVGIVVTGLFILFFLKTKIGLAVRAMSYDIYASRLLGIEVERLYMLIMILVLVPVIIAMLLVAPVWAVDPSMGWGYMITAVLVSVLGGLGNLRGTIIASYIIGFCHSFVSFIIAEPRFMTLSALLVVIIVLIVRPQGIARSESLW